MHTSEESSQYKQIWELEPQVTVGIKKQNLAFLYISLGTYILYLLLLHSSCSISCATPHALLSYIQLVGRLSSNMLMVLCSLSYFKHLKLQDQRRTECLHFPIFHFCSHRICQCRIHSLRSEAREKFLQLAKLFCILSY